MASNDVAQQQADELIVECERFLAGRSAEYLAGNGRPIPAWAWLNVLAHGDETRVHTIATTLRQSDTHERVTTWGQALGRLADEILECAAVVGSVHTVQLATLVPLELRLMANREMAGLGPADLLARARAALRHHPSALG